MMAGNKDEFLELNAEILSALESIPLFQEVAPELLKRIGAYLELKQFEARTEILTEGQVNRNLYFLLSGSVGVYVAGERVATLSRHGEVMGEMSLISLKPVSASVRADEPLELLVLSAADLHEKDPVAYADFQIQQHTLFAPILAERLAMTNEKARRFERTNFELMQAKLALENANLELEGKVRERTDALERQNLELQQAIAYNRSLVRILSHDLSNAVSVIHMTAERAAALGVGMPADKSLRSWQRVLRASERQREIIEQVRMMAAIQAGKMKLEILPVKLKQLLQQTEQLFEEQFAQKQIKLVYEIPEELKVLAEPVTLNHSVINNLVSNAMKFSFPGGIIHVWTNILPDGKIALAIRDQGMGIPASLLTHLFDAEKKTSRLGTSGEKGTGFGMPLVKTCLDQYGATIEIQSKTEEESPSDHGTTITLTFRQSQ